MQYIKLWIKHKEAMKKAYIQEITVMHLQAITISYQVTKGSEVTVTDDDNLSKMTTTLRMPRRHDDV